MLEYEVKKWDGKLDLMPLARQMAEESKIIDFAPEVAIEDMKSLHERGDSDLFVMFDPKGEVVGGMGIVMLDMFWTKDFYAAIRYWYVKPEHRAVALTLVGTARKWAIEKRCPVLLAASSELCVPSEKYLEALQFTKFETIYARNV